MSKISYNNVSFLDIKSTLLETTNSLWELCNSDKINIFNTNRPGAKWGDYGFYPKEVDFFYDLEKPEYIKPNITEARLGDFRNYNHECPPPTILNCPPQLSMYSNANIFNVEFNNDNSDYDAIYIQNIPFYKNKEYYITIILNNISNGHFYVQSGVAPWDNQIHITFPKRPSNFSDYWNNNNIVHAYCCLTTKQFYDPNPNAIIKGYWSTNLVGINGLDEQTSYAPLFFKQEQFNPVVFTFVNDGGYEELDSLQCDIEVNDNLITYNDFNREISFNEGSLKFNFKHVDDEKVIVEDFKFTVINEHFSYGSYESISEYESDIIPFNNETPVSHTLNSNQTFTIYDGYGYIKTERIIVSVYNVKTNRLLGSKTVIYRHPIILNEVSANVTISNNYLVFNSNCIVLDALNLDKYPSDYTIDKINVQIINYYDSEETGLTQGSTFKIDNVNVNIRHNNKRVSIPNNKVEFYLPPIERNSEEILISFFDPITNVNRGAFYTHANYS